MRNGKTNKNKAFTQNWDMVASASTDYERHKLTQQQQIVLISLCEYLKWRTRWTGNPSQDAIDEFRAQTINDILEIDMLDCDEVADCIENSEAVKSALNAFLNGWQNDLIPQKNPDSKQNEDIGSLWNETCDLNVLYAQCVRLVTRTNTAITDWLETLADETTATQITAAIAGLPALENVGLSSLTSLGEVLLTVPLASYEADFTTTYADELACELFCLTRNDCVLTFGDFYNIIYDRVAAVIPEFMPPDDFLNILQWFTAISDYVIDLTSINKADLMFYIVLGGIRFGELVFGSLDDGMQLFRIATMLAADEPSNDWQTLCTDCDEPPDTRIPVIDTACCAGGGTGGTSITADGGGYWIITGTFAISDYRVCVRDEYNRPFTITNVSYPVTAASCAIWDVTGGSCVVDCAPFTIPTTPLDQITWTWNAARAVRFRMNIP